MLQPLYTIMCCHGVRFDIFSSLSLVDLTRLEPQAKKINKQHLKFRSPKYQTELTNTYSEKNVHIYTHSMTLSKTINKLHSI